MENKKFLVEKICEHAYSGEFFCGKFGDVVVFRVLQDGTIQFCKYEDFDRWANSPGDYEENFYDLLDKNNGSYELTHKEIENKFLSYFE